MRAYGSVAVGGNPTTNPAVWTIPTRPRDIEADRARRAELVAAKAAARTAAKALEDARYTHTPARPPARVIPIDRIHELRQAGMAWAQIAATLHIDRRRIKEAYVAAGYTATRDHHPNLKMTPELTAEAARLRQTGMTWARVAAQVGCAEVTVQRAVAKKER